MELTAKVLYSVCIQGLSKRATARQFGIDSRTVDKMTLGYGRSKPPANVKLRPSISTVLIDGQPTKKRHRSKLISERPRDEHGFAGSATIVTNYGAGWQRAEELSGPLIHPSHFQTDLGEAININIMGEVEREINFVAFNLPHSDLCFVTAYPADTVEAFSDGDEMTNLEIICNYTIAKEERGMPILIKLLRMAWENLVRKA